MTNRRQRPAQMMAPDNERFERLLSNFATLGIPLQRATLEEHLAAAEKRPCGHLEFLDAVIGARADLRRQHGIERRLRQAKFREPKSLTEFDWEFNGKTIDRVLFEQLATCDFIRRHDNLVLVGQSGLGKSFLAQGIGRQACANGYRVYYATSGGLLLTLNASLADKTLPQKLRQLARYDLLIIDEFGFDRLERTQAQQAASLFYKLIDARGQQRSTALISNIDFDAWADYLGDPPLAMAFLDRLVDGAIIVKMTGKSYRAHRGQQTNTAQKKPKRGLQPAR